jgi:hypothetical protein
VMKRNKRFTASQSTCTPEINNKNGISSRFKFDINKLSGNTKFVDHLIIGEIRGCSEKFSA